MTPSFRFMALGGGSIRLTLAFDAIASLGDGGIRAKGDRRSRVIRAQDPRRNRPPAQNSSRNRLTHRFSGARGGLSPAQILSVLFREHSAMTPSR